MAMGQDLLNIYKVQAMEDQQPGNGIVGPPVACPIDGVPLLPGPASSPSVELYCPDGNYQYPRDWHQVLGRPSSGRH